MYYFITCCLHCLTWLMTLYKLLQSNKCHNYDEYITINIDECNSNENITINITIIIKTSQ